MTVAVRQLPAAVWYDCSEVSLHVLAVVFQYLSTLDFSSTASMSKVTFEHLEWTLLYCSHQSIGGHLTAGGVVPQSALDSPSLHSTYW